MFKLSFTLCFWAIFVLSSSGFGKSDQPNIVLVLADDLGYHSLGAFGQEKIKTPHVDALAAQGMKLTNFYANPMCSSARASLVTGMHTGHGMIRENHELGGYTDDTEFGQMPLPANFQTLGKRMQEAGYKTAVMGKWGLGGPNSPGIPTRQGIDQFFGYLDQKQAHNYYPTHLWRNEERVDLPNEYFASHPEKISIADPHNPAEYEKYSGEIYSADVIHEEAMHFIEENRERPFFLTMAYTLPHMALQVPDRILERYKGKFEDRPYLAERGYVPNPYPRATYAAMISLLDEYVGDLMRVLRENGLEKDTLVIFTADNGAAVVGGCDPDYFNCSGVLRGRKGSIYEGGIKVPFVAYWPDVIEPGTTSDHLSAIWDLMPTFLEAAGSEGWEPVNGVSFLSVLTGKGTQSDNDFLYWERHKSNGQHFQAVRFGPWKAVRMASDDGKRTFALYNLEKDPSERMNLAEEHPDVAEQAKDYLATRQLAILPEWNFPD